MIELAIPTELHLECGAVVPHEIGTPVYNFYDRKPGMIERLARCAQPPTMPVHQRDGGAAWWVDVRHDDGTSALLDQSRMCSIEFARARRWMA
jgi:hypothetical protein